MSNQSNDLIWEELKDYYEFGVINEEEYQRGMDDVEFANELLHKYKDDFNMARDDAELTAQSDRDDYNSSVSPLI